MMKFIGIIIGTAGLMMTFTCGGGETFLDCILWGGLGLSMLMLGGTMMEVSDRKKK